MSQTITYEQLSFAGGEWDPQLQPSVDLAKYKTANKVMRNFFAHVNGRTSNRQGLLVACQTQNSTTSQSAVQNVKIIPFQFSTTQTYVLEFGHYYMRVLKNGALVMNGSVPYVITTPYPHTAVMALEFTQSADTLFLAHLSYPPQQLQRINDTNWNLTAYAFTGGPFLLDNTDNNLMLSTTGTSGAVTLSATAVTWTQNTSYAVGQVVSYLGNFYKCLIANISGSTSNSLMASPSTVANDTSNGGSLVWNTSTQTVNNTVGNPRTVSQYLKFTNFGFNLPSNAVVLGVQVNVNNSGPGVAGGLTMDSSVKLSLAGTVGGTEHAQSGGWTFAGSNVTYGNSGDLWGFSLAYSDINNTGFGVAIAASLNARPLNINSYGIINSVSITVYYSTGTFATDLANGDWVLTTFSIFQPGHLGALWSLFQYMPCATVAQSSSNGPSSSISCGGTWRFITNGTWAGRVWMEKSLDGGTTWLTLASFFASSDYNANTFGTEDMSNNAPPFLVRANCTLTSGSVQFNVTADPYINAGIVKIVQYLTPISVNAVVVQPIGTANSGTTDWAEGAWSTYRGWPGTVEFTPDDRLMWARTPFQPTTTFITKTSNYYNFNVSDPLVDSDAMQLNLPAKQLNPITNLIPLRAILALTTGGEYSIESTLGVTAPLTPNTVYQRVHGFEGSIDVKPVLIGNRALFVQNLGKVVRDVGYELIYDSFVGANISLFSNHLFFFDQIVDMCYCQNPDSLVYIVMASGEVRILTYLREQQVVTFAPQDTQGKFTACCSVADSVNNYNAPYFVVNRANGQFIEYMPKRMLTTNVQDQYFVDNGGIFDALGQTFQNADFENWTFGQTNAPDYWNLLGSGTVAQTSAPVSNQDQVTNVENGNYSVMLTNFGTDNGILYQSMETAYGASYWQGRSVTFNAWVRCSQANTACVSIWDGVRVTQSTPHTGDGTWQLLTVTATIGAMATVVHAQCRMIANGQAWFDNSYFNSGVSSVTNVAWLNGQLVSILADGQILQQQVVSNGTITLDTNYNKVIYGLPYTSDLQPVNPNIEVPGGGTMQGKVVNIGKAVLKVWNSASGLIGTDFDDLKPIPDLNITSYSDPLPLFTGQINTTVSGGAKNNNSVCIRQVDPLPISVCALIVEIQVGGINARGN